MKRYEILNEEVNVNTTKRIIDAIVAINEEDDENERKVKDFKREPFYIYINSPGGGVYNGLGIIDAILGSKTPIYTVALGAAESMAFIIFLCGTKRLVSQHATLMWHDVSTLSVGKGEEVEEDLTEVKRLRDLLIDITLKTTNIPKEKLIDVVKHKKDWIIDPKTAIKNKMADGYFKSFPTFKKD